MLVVISMGLEYFGCQRNHLHVYCTKFTSHRAEDTATTHFASSIEQDTSVVIEADVGAVGTTNFLLRADDDCLGYDTLLQVRRGDDALDSNDDDITDRGIATARTAEDADTEGFLCTAIVCYYES